MRHSVKSPKRWLVSRRVLALSYVDAVSGEGSLVVNLGDDGTGTRSQRFATRVLSKAGATLDSTPAYEVTFEVANVDQLQLAENSRWERARFVILRPGRLSGTAGTARMANRC